MENTKFNANFMLGFNVLLIFTIVKKRTPIKHC